MSAGGPRGSTALERSKKQAWMAGVERWWLSGARKAEVKISPSAGALIPCCLFFTTKIVSILIYLLFLSENTEN